MSQQRGFTIVELLIATTVVSVILLLVSVMLLNIGNLFNKGMYQSRVQQNTRTISAEIADKLKLSTTVPKRPAAAADGTTVICIGDTSYTFVIGKQLGSGAGQSKHVLWRDSVTGPCVSPAANYLNSIPATSGGSELIGTRSRLTNFSVSGASPYTIDVGVAYGDDDLLCSPTAGDCNTPGNTLTAATIANGDLACKGGTGQSFCSKSRLTTVVVKRMP